MPPSPSMVPGLTDASFPPNGHRWLLRCALGGTAAMGSQAAFQSILSPYRKKEENDQLAPGGPSTALPAAQPTPILKMEGVLWEALHPDMGVSRCAAAKNILPPSPKHPQKCVARTTPPVDLWGRGCRSSPR